MRRHSPARTQSRFAGNPRNTSLVKATLQRLKAAATARRGIAVRSPSPNSTRLRAAPSTTAHAVGPLKSTHSPRPAYQQSLSRAEQWERAPPPNQMPYRFDLFDPAHPKWQ